MNRVITNIRGANAAGKTTLARRFLQNDALVIQWTIDCDGKANQVRTYKVTVPGLELPVWVVGTYDDSKYSGCDKIKSADLICEAVRTAAAQDGHVLFEGFRVSKSWDRFAALRNELVRERKVKWVWAFLHAPLELIIARADARRDEGSRPVDKVELSHVVKQMNNSRLKGLTGFPLDTVVLDAALPTEALYERLVGEMAKREQGL